MQVNKFFSIINEVSAKVDDFLNQDVSAKVPTKIPEIGDVNEKINQLMPSLPIMFATLGAVVVLGIILTFFFYKPVTKMVKKRTAFIQKNIDDSIIAREEAIKLNADAYKELIESRLRASDMIREAKISFEKEKLQMIEKNKKEAEKLYEQAELEIKSLKEKFELEKRDEIISTAIEISKKIINENIQDKTIEKYYDNFMKEK